MDLRDYQQTAVDNVLSQWLKTPALLGVAATGLGKTVIFSHVIKHATKRSIVLANREEHLIQAGKKIHAVAGIKCDIEMGDQKANESMFWGKSKTILASIPTLYRGRMRKFDPMEFDAVIIDEAHHATSPTYRTVIDYFRDGNPNIGLLGVTATPNRTDEQALGIVFDEVAFNYPIDYGIDNGWLVPIQQHAIHVSGLDYSKVKTTAGDLNGKELAQILEKEETLQKMVSPFVDIVGDRKAILFCKTVKEAEMACEIINRYRPGQACIVHGKTEKKTIRPKIISDYKLGLYKYFVNVGIATEGFDDPSTSVIGLGYPTKSSSKYTQEIGRGLRPLDVLASTREFNFGTAEYRKAAIAASEKPFAEVVDFVGNSGRHKLITSVDILGGDYSDSVKEIATELIEKEGEDGQGMGVDEALAKAKALEEERKQAAEAAKRKRLMAKADYEKQKVNAFDRGDSGGGNMGSRSRKNNASPQAQRDAALKRAGYDNPGQMTTMQIQGVLNEVHRRQRNGLASTKQAKILKRFGYDPDCTMEIASKIMGDIASPHTGGGSFKGPYANQKQGANV